jgi:hypothetical protein
MDDQVPPDEPPKKRRGRAKKDGSAGSQAKPVERERVYDLAPDGLIANGIRHLRPSSGSSGQLAQDGSTAVPLSGRRPSVG